MEGGGKNLQLAEADPKHVYFGPSERDLKREESACSEERLRKKGGDILAIFPRKNK